MPLVAALFVPNAPFLISPSAFGGVGEEAARDLQNLKLRERFRPEGILVASPHWSAPGRFRIQAAPVPRQIYDFSGFPRELYSVRYAPPGDPPLARLLEEAGTREGVPVETTQDWGLDHGAWAPLIRLWPEGDLPTLPLSISDRSPEDHVKWGAVVGEALRHEPRRLVMVGTGSLTHSFSRMDPTPGARWTQGESIEREIVDLALRGQTKELTHFDRAKWETVEPEGNLGPLFMVLGALRENWEGRLVSTSQVYGAFGMSILEFSEGTPAPAEAGPRP